MAKVVIDNHLYLMTNNELKNVINQIKTWHKGQNIVLAVEKDGITMFLKESYPSSKKLTKAVKEWQNQGYSVTYNRKVF